ncbi:MAG: YccF domain-containing protein [Phascolarctobacterium sp.]|nr:YccF domain-containing protein [Phascolarctobacterium sp.]
MSIVGNIIWFVFGGIFSGLCWYVVGLLWCLTFIGIPVGLQCFKLGRLSFFPFGKNITLSNKTSSILLNILWLIFGGIELALAHVSIGLGFCVTIIGIPFGLQHFKLAKLAFLPFGAEIKD